VISMILPTYITATLSEMWRSTVRSLGDEEVRLVEARLQVLQQVHHLRPDAEVQRADRLVTHDERGPMPMRCR